MSSSRGDVPAERILYEERYWWPWKGLLLIAAYTEAVAIAIVVIGRPDTTSVIILFAVATGGVAFWIALFQLSARRLWHRVGERTMRFGRCAPFPVEAVREVQLVTGAAEVKRWTKRLGQGAHFFGSSFDPNIKGVLAPPGTETAVLIEVDPASSRTHTFLIGTHHPKQLLEAVFAATSAAGLSAAELGSAVS